MSKEKEIIYDKNHFMKCFQMLSTNQHSYTAWSDIIELFALSIINPLTKQAYFKDPELKKVWDNRENRYLKIINNYSKEKQELLPQMFACIVNEFENNPEQDLLGQIYMRLEISNGNAGQFFTPYNICQCMSEIIVDKKQLTKTIKEKGYATLNDEACGGGATLIAGINTAKRMFKRLNWQNHIYVYANDIDRICAYMCYIQLSLLGVAAEITIGDALTEPNVTDPNRILYTPMHFSEVWSGRRLWHNMDRLIERTERAQTGS